MLVFVLYRKQQNVTAIARDKVLLKVEKVLNFWVEGMNRKRVPLFIIVYYYFI